MLTALIFDLDGTLADTNEAHTQSWVRGLKDHGYTMTADRIRPEMGKGGDNLFPDLFGQEAEEKDGEAVRKSVAKRYEEIAAREKLSLYDGAVELLA